MLSCSRWRNKLLTGALTGHRPHLESLATSNCWEPTAWPIKLDDVTPLEWWRTMPANYFGEPEYGTWEFTLFGALEEERKLNPQELPPDIWPHWAEGVPTRLRRSGWSEGFSKNGVTYRSRLSTYTIELEWRKPRNLSSLADNYRHLPGL